MKKRLILILMMLFFITIPIMSASEIPIGTIDYLEDDLLYIPGGNVSLVYNYSETGTDDISIIWSAYVSSNNLTIIAVNSKEIMYDHTFINNTKDYFFTDVNSENTYIISVDYSSIEVPIDIADILNNTIDFLYGQIYALTVVIEEMNASLGLLGIELEGKDAIIENLYKEIGDALTERDNYKGLVAPLRYELNLTKDDLKYFSSISENLTIRVDQLEERVDYYNSVVKTVTNPMTGIYNLNGIDNVMFNVPSVIIGVIITLIILYLLRDWIKKSRENSTGDKKNRGMLSTILYAIKFKVFGNRFKKKKNEPSIDETIDKHDEKELSSDEPKDTQKPPENSPETKKPTQPTQSHSEVDYVGRIHEIHESIDVMIT